MVGMRKLEECLKSCLKVISNTISKIISKMFQKLFHSQLLNFKGKGRGDFTTVVTAGLVMLQMKALPSVTASASHNPIQLKLRHRSS